MSLPRFPGHLVMWPVGPCWGVVVDCSAVPILLACCSPVLNASRCRLYQLIRLKIARLVSDLVANLRRWTSSRFRLDQKDSATALSQH